MDKGKFDQLVELAKNDPAFFHALVFDPEKTMEKTGFLDRSTKGAIVGKDPAEIVAKIAGINQYCGNTCSSSCDNTCGGSCGFTTNLQAPAQRGIQYFSRLSSSVFNCGNTCTSSCDNTCGGSCGFTTNLTDNPRFSGFQQFQ